VAAVNAFQVAAFVGAGSQTDDVVALAQEHLPVITAMVSAYTRGQGFTNGVPGDDLAAVIVSATARSVGNPGHAVTETVGTVSIRHGLFNGWTLPELAILHSYRRRAA